MRPFKGAKSHVSHNVSHTATQCKEGFFPTNECSIFTGCSVSKYCTESCDSQTGQARCQPACKVSPGSPGICMDKTSANDKNSQSPATAKTPSSQSTSAPSAQTKRSAFIHFSPMPTHGMVNTQPLPRSEGEDKELDKSTKQAVYTQSSSFSKEKSRALRPNKTRYSTILAILSVIVAMLVLSSILIIVIAFRRRQRTSSSQGSNQSQSTMLPKGNRLNHNCDRTSESSLGMPTLSFVRQSSLEDVESAHLIGQENDSCDELTTPRWEAEVKLQHHKNVLRIFFFFFVLVFKIHKQTTSKLSWLFHDSIFRRKVTIMKNY